MMELANISNVLETFTDEKELSNFCENGTCPQLVLKQAAHENRHIYQLAADTVRCIVIPAILWYLSCILWNIYIISKVDPKCPFPLPPGDFGLPILGETIHLLLNSTYFQNRRTKHGSIYKTHLLGNPTIRVIGSEAVKQILRGENSLVSTQWPSSTCQLLGEGCISHATGSDHVTKKRSLMKAFTYKALSDYIPAIQTITRGYIQKWCKDGSVFGYPEFRTLNFSLSCRVLAGLQMDYDECSRLMEVFEAFTSNIFCLPVNLPGSGFRKAMNARKVLLDKIDDVIRSRESGSDTQQTDLLDIIMNSKDSESISNTELKNLCLEMLFAGHGTTSSAACFLVSELSKLPLICHKIEEEMKTFDLGGKGNGNDLDLTLLNKMHYLNNVVKEALRICPPIGGGFRKALKTFVLDGYQVPAGWSVVYGIRDTHETSTSYADPDTFDPDRWNMPEAKENNFSYLPFGGGRRACAGKDLAKLMLKVFVIELMRGCKWSLSKQKSNFKMFPMPHPTDDLPLTMTAL